SLAGSLRAHLDTLERDAVLAGEHGADSLRDRYPLARVRPAAAPRDGFAESSRLVVTVPIDDGREVDLAVGADDLVEGDRPLRRPGELAVFVAPPGDPVLHALDGRATSSRALADALGRGAFTLRLTREQAAEVGLPARTSMAGFARVDA